jgi:hypothetical protein
LVGAAHHVDVDEAAERGVRYALELRNGGNAAMVGHGAVAAKSEGLDIREEDGIFLAFALAGAGTGSSCLERKKGSEKKGKKPGTESYHFPFDFLSLYLDLLMEAGACCCC